MPAPTFVIPNARPATGDFEPRSTVAAKAGFHVSPLQRLRRTGMNARCAFSRFFQREKVPDRADEGMRATTLIPCQIIPQRDLHSDLGIIQVACGLNGCIPILNFHDLPSLCIEIGPRLFDDLLMRNTKPRSQFSLRLFDAEDNVFLGLDKLLNGFRHEKRFRTACLGAECFQTVPQRFWHMNSDGDIGHETVSCGGAIMHKLVERPDQCKFLQKNEKREASPYLREKI
jgi:hypothetical protein